MTSSQCSPVTTRPAASTTPRIRRASAAVDPLGRVGERERRDLEPVVAEPRRELALRLERQLAEHFVAEGELHRRRAQVRRRISERAAAPAPPVTRLTAALNAGT